MSSSILVGGGGIAGQGWGGANGQGWVGAWACLDLVGVGPGRAGMKISKKEENYYNIFSNVLLQNGKKRIWHQTKEMH